MGISHDVVDYIFIENTIDNVREVESYSGPPKQNDSKQML